MAYVIVIASRIWYLALLTGILLLFYPDIKRMLPRRKKASRTLNEFRSSSIYIHLEKIFASLSETGTVGKNSVAAFLGLSLFLFLIVNVIIMKQDGSMAGLVVSIAFGFLPYVCLRFRKFNIQHKASYEAEVLIEELLNEYRTNYYNMAEAIDVCFRKLDSSLRVKNYLYRLSLKTRNARNEDELAKALEDFVYSINTDWSKMLANNIKMALEDGTDVTSGLESLLADCREINETLERGKRQNTEAFTIMQFFSPLAYLVFIWMMINWFDLSLKEIIDYQLNTEKGAQLFLGIILISFVNYVIAIVSSKEKFDY